MIEHLLADFVVAWRDAKQSSGSGCGPAVVLCNILFSTMASSALLEQIQAGRKLKKAETKDRSAPIIDVKPSGGGAIRAGGASSAAAAAMAGPGAGPPQLGGLFAGGMPKLKPAGQS